MKPPRPSITHVLTLVVACLLPLAGRASAAVVTYQQGGTNAFVTNYSGVDDAAIASGTPAGNFGQFGASVAPTGRRGLVRFDLSTFTGQYTDISAVSLTLNLAQIQGAVTSGTINA